MARVLAYNATMTRREDVAEGLAIFHVQLDAPLGEKPGLDVPFLPGQYLTIGLNRPDSGEADTQPASVLRPMTIASPPQASEQLEFYVRYIEKPETRLPLTHLMWSLEPGSRLFVRPSATGRFTEPDTYGELGSRDLIMVAGDTGLAPFISLLRSKLTLNAEADLRNHVLLHGASQPDSLGYRQELERMVESHGLKHLTTVSRPHESRGWRGEFGRVDQLLDDERIAYTEEALDIEIFPERAVVLVCGLGSTISLTVHHLLARGFVPDHRRLRKVLGIENVPSSLFFEQFDANPPFELQDTELVKTLRSRWDQQVRREQQREISVDAAPDESNSEQNG